MTRQYHPPAVRRQQILQSALTLAVRHGYRHVTRDQIASHARISTGLINRYFATIETLQHEVMAAAVARRLLDIVAQGLAARDPIALGAPLELRESAAKMLAAL